MCRASARRRRASGQASARCLSGSSSSRIARACAAFGRAGLRLCVQLWPLWLAWGALRLSLRLWRDGVLLSADMDQASVHDAFASTAWPSAGLLGPILLMLIALALHRAGHAARVTALALTLCPAWDDLAVRTGTAPPLDLQDARADEAFVIACGHKPLRCGRAIYFRRPEMVAQVAPSRFHDPHRPKASE